MVDRHEDRDDAGSAAFQGGSRVASITPEGQALNQSITEKHRVTAVPKREGETGLEWNSDASDPRTEPDGGFGTAPSDSHPGERTHEGGDAALDGDAQYGASPIRSARYDENHDAIADIAEGKTRSGRHGGQARYPTASEISNEGGTGHDEQQLSRDLGKNSR